MSDLNFLDTSGNKQTITVPATNSMAFNTANTERLRIESNGNVDIKSGIIKLGSGSNRRLMYRTGENDILLEADSGDFYRQDIANSTHEFFTGNVERFRISSEGFIVKPNNPSFRATREGSEITHSAVSIQQWNTVSGANRSFDRYTAGGYGFNTSTYKYKVPVTGVWYFHAAVYTNAGYSCMFDIRTSGQILQRAEDNSGSNMPNNNIVHASCVVTCNKDDEVYVNQSGGQGKLIATQGYISFDGHFIG